ncbi:MAG: ABC transporter substrate-binding protein [Hydrogenophaga sp.]|uniref:ABC transporter substrate-binding protein n=1 Tax=Hydrogenophaga sp. TaxID=1904254 RepID=UPI0027204CF5|nr:ABC transporter substrate-binding protein [Hydrogenophaga sp.]MDO9029585.1 ABC transporter substrate-binding protein [Hydrogenophaga sp.]
MHPNLVVGTALWALLASPLFHPAQAAEKDPGGPIRVGAVSSLSGPTPFPESSAAVRAYFDMVNASGGIKGRTLELVVEDDRGDPKQANRSAIRLIDDPRVVALVGSASIVDCTTNGADYQAGGLMALQGTGVEPACFNASHIVPVNTGPYLSFRNALQFARGVLKSQRPCAFLFDIPGMRPAYEAMVERWQREDGRPLTLTRYFTPAEDPSALVRQATEARCDAVVHTGVEPLVIVWVKAAQTQPALANVPMLFLTPAYTERVATELSNASMPLYAMAEFEPWSSRSPSLTDWRSVMQRGKVPLSSFSQGGYTAAQLFVRTLRGMDGEITRTRVTEALRGVKDMELSMIGTRLSIGRETAHNPNRATLPMKLEQGRWRIASPFWVVAP